MAADDLQLNLGTGGKKTRSLKTVAGIDWPVSLSGYATTVADGANVCMEVTPATGLPVQPQSGATFPVQAVDGSLATIGALADAAASDGVSSWSVVSLLKGILAKLLGTLNIGGTVAVSNFPSSSAVSNFPAGFLSTQSGAWSVAVNNFPATQPVSGTVAVTGTFWQATQPVSAASLPLPTGAATETTLAALSGKVTACDTGSVVISSGSLTANIGTTNGMALDNTLTGGTQKTLVYDGTNVVFTSAHPGVVQLPATQAGGVPLGQALAAGSVPVVLPALQQAALSQPTASPGTWTDRSGTITVGGMAQSLCGSNASRKSLFIQNNSTGSLWINFTTAAVVGQPSIQLLPNAILTFEGPYISTEAVSIIGATTSQAFTAKEG